jgi:hypothetical protein
MEASERAHHSSRCAANNLQFLSIVMESYGGFGPSAVPALCRLAHCHANYTGELYASCKKQSFLVFSNKTINRPFKYLKERNAQKMVV